MGWMRLRGMLCKLILIARTLFRGLSALLAPLTLCFLFGAITFHFLYEIGVVAATDLYSLIRTSDLLPPHKNALDILSVFMLLSFLMGLLHSSSIDAKRLYVWAVSTFPLTVLELFFFPYTHDLTHIVLLMLNVVCFFSTMTLVRLATGREVWFCSWNVVLIAFLVIQLEPLFSVAYIMVVTPPILLLIEFKNVILDELRLSKRFRKFIPTPVLIILTPIISLEMAITDIIRKRKY